MVHTELHYKQNKNLDFAKAVFKSIINLACEHGNLNCRACDGRKAKDSKYYYANQEEINKKKRARWRKQHPQLLTFFY